MGRYYAVFNGRNDGVYNTWAECKKEVHRFKGSNYKAFTTKKEAIYEWKRQAQKTTNVYTTAEKQLNTYIRSNFPEWGCKDIKQVNKELKPNIQKLEKLKNESRTFTKPTFGLSVDGSFAGNPGKGEYQCVDIETKEVIFSSSKFKNTTNNLMEFFALVEVIKYKIENNIKKPIYTDSIVAMSWVKNKKTKTRLKKMKDNFDTFAFIEKHEEYLRSIKGKIKIEKWHTKIWGEIPADFGRKK